MARSDPPPTPPTIGSFRALGVTAMFVSCPVAGGCAREGRVAHATLALPDATPWPDIPILRRLVCRRCGRRSRDIFPDWSDHIAVGNGRRPVARER